MSVTWDMSVVFSGYSTNKTDRHDITEILLKVALITINLSTPYGKDRESCWFRELVTAKPCGCTVNIQIFGNIHSPENTDVNVIYLFKTNQRTTTIAIMVEEIIIVYKIKQAKQFSLSRTFDDLLLPIQQPFGIHLHPH